jgi:hypothetical protein
VLALVVLGLAGGLAALWTSRRRSGDDGPIDSGRRGAVLPGIGAIGWLLLAAYGAVTLASVADFVSKGGSMHPRYFFGLIPATSALLAGAITALPLRRVVGLVAVGGLLVVTLSQLRRYESLIGERESTGRLVLTDRPAGVPVQWLLLGLAIVAVGILVMELMRSPTATPPVAAEGSDPG